MSIFVKLNDKAQWVKAGIEVVWTFGEGCVHNYSLLVSAGESLNFRGNTEHT